LGYGDIVKGVKIGTRFTREDIRKIDIVFFRAQTLTHRVKKLGMVREIKGDHEVRRADAVMEVGITAVVINEVVSRSTFGALKVSKPLVVLIDTIGPKLVETGALAFGASSGGTKLVFW